MTAQVVTDRLVRVVVADDEQDLVRLLGRRLDREPGFELVGTAHDGTSAVEVIRAVGPDVVLLDVEMSGMDGIEVARRVRAMGLDIGICIYSGRLEAHREVDALQGIADAWLQKTAPWDVVRDTLVSIPQVSRVRGASS